MKVLVVGGGGSGARSGWKLSQSPRVSKLYCAPGNGGIGQIVQNVPIASHGRSRGGWFRPGRGVIDLRGQDTPGPGHGGRAAGGGGLRAFGPNQAATRSKSARCSPEPDAKYHIPRRNMRPLTRSRGGGLHSGAARGAPGGQGRRTGPGQGRHHRPEPGRGRPGRARR